MCGIAGWIDYESDLRERQCILSDMSKTMVRRGPDAHGEYIADHVALIHRRLIVVDPQNGVQPMSRTRGNANYTISYNGELYNTEDIRKELVEMGYNFRGHSDTEVVLLSYIAWGEDCVHKFNGIYAFAIWNDEDESLFLVRDRVGVKPLFYALTGEGLIFASEIKTLLANPVIKPVIDKEGLADILLIGPGRTPGQGIFRGIEELCAGECATYSKNGFKKRKYWTVTAEEFNQTQDECIEYTRYLVTDAISRQLVSDVPLCCMLSGGLDSSIISAVAAKHYRDRGEQLHTFSVDYVDNDKYFKSSSFQPNADHYYIDIMQKFLDTAHHNVIIDTGDLSESLFSAVDARDLPGMTDVDSSLLLFCGEIKKEFTVCLSGECADEIFAGYPWYHNKEILYDDNFPWCKSVGLRKRIIKKGLLGINEEDYVRQRYLDTCRNTPKLATDSPIDSRMREMFMLNIGWFMQTLLDRKDRMSMYNGLEVRVPFCDYRIMQYAYNVPWSIKALDGREKGLLRKAVEDILPEKIVYRKKSPYPKTHNPNYFSAVKKMLSSVINDPSSPIIEICDLSVLRELVENAENNLNETWYGQLMTMPQIFAFLLQINYWLEKGVDII